MAFKGFDRMRNAVASLPGNRDNENEFDKIRREHRERDAASPEGKQMEAEKKLEETAKKIKEGKIPAPSNDDSGPLPEKKYKKGGSVSSASKRADGCATKGKTKGRII